MAKHLHGSPDLVALVWGLQGRLEGECGASFVLRSKQRGCRHQQDLSSPEALSFSQEQTSPSMAASVPSIFLLAAKLLISFLLL